MKKLLSLLLCLVLGCAVLVSCDEEREFGSYLSNYGDYVPEVEEKLTLNLYIITDDKTAENAKDTVALNISLHTASHYNTDLKVHYIKASQYQSKVIEAASANDETAAHIVLINNIDLMRDLAKGKNAGGVADLVELNDYLATDDYGTLNVSIAPALLDSVKDFGQGSVYAIPNNRINLCDYEYVLIDKWANDEFKVIPPSMFENDLGPDDLVGFDALLKELKTTLTESGKNPADYIKTASGSYELQAALEADGKYECIVTKNPTVTHEIAFESAFAIIDRGEKYNERAMEMVYAINNDVTLRNLLQYGVKDINYTVDENGDFSRIDGDSSSYIMNVDYTGDIFTLSYSSEIGWTAAVAENVKMQNKEAVAFLVNNKLPDVDDGKDSK
jgi:hypothetical protein